MSSPKVLRSAYYEQTNLQVSQNFGLGYAAGRQTDVVVANLEKQSQCDQKWLKIACLMGPSKNLLQKKRERNS